MVLMILRKLSISSLPSCNSQDTSVRDSLLPTLTTFLSEEYLDGAVVSEECVIGAFSHLKCDKSDGTNLVSDDLVYALLAISVPFFFGLCYTPVLGMARVDIFG